MNAYGAMYPPTGQAMGTYPQTASSYGPSPSPSRGAYGGGGDKAKPSGRGGFHPYRR